MYYFVTLRLFWKAPERIVAGWERLRIADISDGRILLQQRNAIDHDIRKRLRVMFVAERPR